MEPGCDPLAASLHGLVTEADLPLAEQEWPGLLDFLRRLPHHQRPGTFLELVWRFERWRATEMSYSWSLA